MRPRQHGFALLVVLLLLGFLALLGTQLVAAGRGDTRLSDNLKQAAVLEAAADGAIAHAMFAFAVTHDPRFRPGMPVQELRIGTVPVIVGVRNEGDRINLNTCPQALLWALMAELGVPPPQSARLAAAILDWRTGGDQPRPNGAKAPQYRAAGLTYGPPNAPFRSVDELRQVLGMTPSLFALMAPHLTVLTDGDPDLSTQDPVVARALAEAAGANDADTPIPGNDMDTVLRITATAIGPGGTRYTVAAVVAGAFRDTAPRLQVLLRERCTRDATGHPAAACL